MEPAAVNRFTITKSLFYEGMLRITRERLGPYSVKLVPTLAGLWAVLALLTLWMEGEQQYVWVELAIIAAVGVWMGAFLPRNRAQRGWQAMVERNGGEPERTTRFYDDRLEFENGGEVRTVPYENVQQTLSAEHLVVLVCEDNVGVLIARDGFVTGDMDTVLALIGKRENSKRRDLR